jgi:hypothetical protein
VTVPEPKEPTVSAEPITIRPASSDDDAPLARLADLDSARPLRGDVLVAVAGGRLVAAVSVADGRVIADPFVPTAGDVRLLRARAELLPGDRRRERAGLRRFVPKGFAPAH